MMSFTDVDKLAVRTIRVLSADCVEKANAGHPGAPIGMAPVAHVLWSRILKCNPLNSAWPNRDRFVLSNGHGCALQYVMLHLCGYDVSMDDLKSFRQLNSRTPGHPENFCTDGVEVSTGPLGQGIAQGVGMALGAKHFGAQFNKPGFDVIDHKVWVFCGDGCLMEGVSSEASSLAGHWGLDNFVIIYDDNNISIDGHTDLSFTEDSAARYRSYGFDVHVVDDGNNDLDAIVNVLELAKKATRPVFICLKTIIGFGSNKENTHGVHGAPLGKESMALFKEKMGFKDGETFVVPQEVRDLYKTKVTEAGQQSEKKWNEMMGNYATNHPEDAKTFWRIQKKELPQGWDAKMPAYDDNTKKMATRNMGGEVLNALAPFLPEVMGGSADLTPSTKTLLKCTTDFQKANPAGRHVRYGVREFGMFAIANGLSAYGMIPFTATFLNFITYGWGAVRLGALSHLQHVYVMTHDSIFLGEDGPTHQPVEVLPLLRATPNLVMFRPAEGREVIAAWKYGVTHRGGPTVICLSRQGTPPVKGASVEKAMMGAYVAQAPDGGPSVVLISSGTEVAMCVSAAEVLAKSGVKVQIVSCPSQELFDQQPAAYRRTVLPPGVPVISVEASSSVGWSQYSHFQVAVDRFGASGKLADIQDFFGFTAGKIAEATNKFLGQLEDPGAILTSKNIPILKAHL